MDIPRLFPPKSSSAQKFSPGDFHELPTPKEQAKKLADLKRQVGDVATALSLLQQYKYDQKKNREVINSLHYLIGTMYRDGTGGVNVDINEAFKHFNEVKSSLHSAAFQKSTDAIFMLNLNGHLFVSDPSQKESIIADTITFMTWHCSRFDSKDYVLMGKIICRLAELHLQLGESEKANALYQEAANDYKSPDACFILAKSINNADAENAVITQCSYFLKAAIYGHPEGASQFEACINNITETSDNRKSIARLKFQFAEHLKETDPIKAYTYLEPIIRAESLTNKKANHLFADLICKPEITCLLNESDLSFFLKKAADHRYPHSKAALKYAEICLKNEGGSCTASFFKSKNPTNSDALRYLRIASEAGKINEFVALLLPLIKAHHPDNLANTYYECYLILTFLEQSDAAFIFLERAYHAKREKTSSCLISGLPPETATTATTLKTTSLSFGVHRDISSLYGSELAGKLGQLLTDLLKHPIISDKPSAELLKAVKLYYKMKAANISSELEYNQFNRLCKKLSPAIHFNLAMEIKKDFPYQALDHFKPAISANIPEALRQFADLYCRLPVSPTSNTTAYTEEERYLKLAAELPNPNKEVLYYYGNLLFNREIKTDGPYNSLSLFAKSAAEGDIKSHIRCIEIDALKNNHPQSAKIIAEAYRIGQFALPNGFIIATEKNPDKAEKYQAIAGRFTIKKIPETMTDSIDTEEEITPSSEENILTRFLNWCYGVGTVTVTAYASHTDL